LAAEADYRRRCAALLSHEDYTVFTTGGTPASLGMMFGGLEALVSVEPQAVHDASYLPILAAQGTVSICTRDGSFLTLDEISTCFESVTRWTDKPVPPFVAARNPRTAKTLADLLLQGEVSESLN
jgi:hypothetical protein